MHHMRLSIRRHVAKILACAFAAIAASIASVATADETQISPDPIADYEFDHENNLLTWSDKSNNLWVANIDPVTGAFQPVNGQGILADTGAAFTTDFGNGPEWVYTSAGNQIVYTKYMPGQPHDGAHAGIARAQLKNGIWSGDFLPNGMGLIEPMGSLDSGDPDPRIAYRVGTGGWQMYTRQLNASTQQMVPNSAISKGSERWVPGNRSLIFTQSFVDGKGAQQRQVFLYNFDSQVTEQLTFDQGNKGASFMWQAPEFGGAYVFFTVVNSTTLRMYRQIYNAADHQYEWTVIGKVSNLPGASQYISSPEPFIYKGKSYIFYVRSSSAATSNVTVPTQIWLASLSGAVDKEITDPAITDRVRIDPEYFITTQGPYIYYNRYTLATPEMPAASEGIYRSSTGITP